MRLLSAINMEGKGCMGKFFGGNDAELVSNAVTHLHSKLKAELQFFWLNVLRSAMRVEELQEASGSLLDRILIAAGHALKDNAGHQVCLEVTTPE
jgi:hypothetical protein